MLAQFSEPDEAAVLSFENVGVLRTDSSLQNPPELLAARGFAGHSGWGPGQLDSELERDDWILERARSEDAFCSDPDSLWSQALERKGGRDTLVARMPLNPSLN